MQIARKLQVLEIKASLFRNEPFKVILKGQSFSDAYFSTVVFDQATCKRFNIPMTTELVGKFLLCSFESREISQINKASELKAALKPDDLTIEAVERKEITTYPLLILPLNKLETVSFKLKLSGGAVDNCPCYRFVLELNETEYAAVKAFPPGTVFSMKVQIAP